MASRLVDTKVPHWYYGLVTNAERWGFHNYQYVGHA